VTRNITRKMTRYMIRNTARRRIVWAAAFFFVGFLSSGTRETAAAQSAPPDGSQQSSHSSPPQSDGAKPNAAADKDPIADTSSTARQQKPATQRKVITNDDIDAEHAREAEGTQNGKTGVIYATGLCDAECADEAREAMGFGPQREGEWQIRLVTARRNLQADTDWRRAYSSLGDALNTYCTFQYQLQTAMLPTSNTWDAGIERAKRQQYSENMERVLMQRVQGANIQLVRIAQAVRPVEPVRATIMNVLVSRLYGSSCMGEDP